jgi:methionyl-tRNA synthetase
MPEPRFFITTPIYYANDVPHIGHAYCSIGADVQARYQRARGREVFFLTGLDAHGQKMDKASKEKGYASPGMLVEDAGYHQRRLHPHHGGAAQARGAKVLRRGAGRRLHRKALLQGQLLRP